MTSSIPSTTTSIAATAPGPVDADTSFVVVESETPTPTGHDLLVAVKAVSVNPVDVKVRSGFDADAAPKVLGFDAAGVVVAVGPDVTTRAVGDEVFYAGSIARPGTNTSHHLVDERVVGRKPSSIDFAEAAALPLTSITAWEALFEVLEIPEGASGTVLVSGGAGGTGSMVTQLARALTDLTVVATASRDESREWATRMGAHHVVDRHDLVSSVREVAPGGVDHVFSAFSDGNVEAYAELLRVRGAVVAIDDPEGLDTMPLKSKSQSWRWEFMFTLPLQQPENDAQARLLDRIADLVDEGRIVSTMNRTLSPLGVDTLREAHRILESSGTVGKVVITAD
ncbi:zinc-binding alcohol dehydrogenase family protein [Williamsia serinedens]|uniref:Zinc-type alcohol dehydrogenase-like protein n=1 Tax=Williamsia serinedens TaxID=391736 RepID=A0ABT1H0D5_9NOCA|nr:zinc-binding alcohol dehydrogenase family protein [Williamsia serinedens]MCP2160695.1 zinc-binding alcohol dehydrogenase family protein [Williamsia serinedens]